VTSFWTIVSTVRVTGSKSSALRQLSEDMLARMFGYCRQIHGLSGDEPLAKRYDLFAEQDARQSDQGYDRGSGGADIKQAINHPNQYADCE
jgi:hypothetical protein